MSVPLLPDDPHDRRLAAHVRPPAWVNPTPKPRYQLVVIGGGPAGLVAAAGAAAVGATVALVERDLLGGDCLNVGCVPSKTLLRAAKAAADARHAKSLGVHLPEPAIDFPAVMDRVRRVRADLALNDSAERFTKLGVDVFRGDGRFLNEETVEVGNQRLRFGRCLVATGTRAAVPDVPGLKESRWFTNESIFSLTGLPRRLLVVGGGPIGCELGQAFARLGSAVTLSAKQLLPKEDDDAAAAVRAALEADGVTFADAPPTGFDAVLVAAGRTPNVDGLNLSAAGVAYDPKLGIRVDDALRTTNPRVYAAGDCTTFGHRFTHAADACARVAVRNALFPGLAKASALVIPWTTFTDPEVGRVGLSEREAAERREPVDMYRVAVNELDRGAADGATGFVKVLAASGTDRILGATAVGPRAGELTAAVSLLMANGIGLKRFGSAVLPYPTYADALRKLADQYSRTRLTPLSKRVLSAWLRWFV